ncbi:MAG: hypothetical protein JRF59_12380 [Deltaproteobacteria bacterium]|nr:hypothetical protein [Deltaproteobacteria bacterium]MBW1924952.1 hypothetical protein [Deltaproteobacteria bacterium]MBW1948851.1 hypothetical protein [Deltaproteobacteria bacterium]MBW2006698.1 hypothetical protein [Deltaproteobacteria bacterium]MBW2102059.1 hypothetical protein [Deltaproteobacteria bacterium]
MDEREYERGFAEFHRSMNRVLRKKDIRAFKRLVAAHPRQAGRLSHCLGLSDELAEIEMYKTIMIRSPLKDLHQEARAWLEERGIAPPVPRPVGRRKRGRRRKRP